MKKKRIFIIGGIVLFMMFCLWVCADDEEIDTAVSEDTEETDSNKTNAGETEDTWAVYLYLCGSDLESSYGAATDDLYELQKTELPENVQVIIETGGSSDWYHEDVEAGQLGRYVYDTDGLSLVEEQPEANMGEAETLADFLGFCRDNYPADHTMLVMWNHGGGSAAGVAFDEVYDMDSLTLDEMHQAFASVYELSEENPPFEMVGFDACLMATIDTAAMLSDVSHYLVASQETEPGCGWEYSKWVQGLGDNPAMDGAELGKIICDSYVEGCEDIDSAEEVTLSVVDLQKVGELLAVYDNLGKEALAAAYEEPMFFADFGREASRSENYGGNSPNSGYTNMVDLGHLVRNGMGLFGEAAQPVLDALDACVVYKVNGAYRQEATGLSCYYSYNGDEEDFYNYASVCASEAFLNLYSYELSGELSEDAFNYISEEEYEEAEPAQEIPCGENYELNDFPLYVDEDSYAVMELGADAASVLKDVYFQLCYISIEDDIIMSLGRDNDIDCDWENGIFRDNFRGVWGSIDGNLCYMEITYSCEDYNLYSVPVLLNGEECTLRVVYRYDTDSFEILGARKEIDDNGMADKNLITLKPGDEITTLHYGMTISGDDSDWTEVPVDTITVTEDTSFYEEDMGDGVFCIMYEMIDAQNDSYFSNTATFTVEDGMIYTEVD